MRWVVIAYRKICEGDRAAVVAGRMLPRRFELHTGLKEDEARTLFQTYKTSTQVLAVEIYGEGGLVDRHDLLVELVKENASQFQYAKACHSFN